MADLSAAIAKAKQAGYSDADIAAYIAKDPTMGPKVQQARQHGYSDAEIVAHLSPAPKESLGQKITGFMANVNRGLGIGDELAAGAQTVADVVAGKAKIQDAGDAFNANMARQRATESGYQANHPHMAALAKGTGAALTMAAPVGPGAEAFAAPLTIAGRTVPTVVANAARGATLANLTGAGYAALDAGTAKERAAAASRAATDPVTAALGAAAGAIATPRGAKPQAKAAPTLDELTAQKNAAYKAVDDSGVAYKPEAFDGLVSDITTTLGKARFNPKLHPKTAAMLDHINGLANQAAGHAPTLTDLDQLRQVIGRDVASSSDPGERLMGQMMRQKIDSFIASAGPDQIIAGDPQAAAKLIQQARGLNTRVEKLRTLDGLDEAAADRAGATGTGGNINNATRQNIIRFQTRVNNLTPDEAAMTQKIIRGTPVGNALREVGSFSPQGGTVRAGASIVTGAMSHGAIPAAGFISKLASDAITARNVQALRDLIASGGVAAAEVSRQLADPRYAEIRAQLANDLAVQAGIQGSSRRGSVTAEVVGHPEYGKGASRR